MNTPLTLTIVDTADISDGKTIPDPSLDAQNLAFSTPICTLQGLKASLKPFKISIRFNNTLHF